MRSARISHGGSEGESPAVLDYRAEALQLGDEILIASLEMLSAVDDGSAPYAERRDN